MREWFFSARIRTVRRKIGSFLRHEPEGLEIAGIRSCWKGEILRYDVAHMAEGVQIQAALACLESGDRSGLDSIIPVLYQELHRLAEIMLSRERPDHTLQPTALVHEAYLRLVGQYQVDWNCRAQIVGLAATMMRRILVKYAQTRNAQKRDWGSRIPLEDDLCITTSGSPDILSVDAALSKLEEIDGRQARIVELRFFSGLTVEETAAVMDLSTATIKREWKIARMWLLRELE